MKNLKNRVREGNYFLYSFDLDQCYHPENCPPGYLVLYTIVKCDNLPIERILLNHWGDIHAGSIKSSLLSRNSVKEQKAQIWALGW